MRIFTILGTLGTLLFAYGAQAHQCTGVVVDGYVGFSNPGISIGVEKQTDQEIKLNGWIGHLPWHTTWGAEDLTDATSKVRLGGFVSIMPLHLRFTAESPTKLKAGGGWLGMPGAGALTFEQKTDKKGNSYLEIRGSGASVSFLSLKIQPDSKHPGESYLSGRVGNRSVRLILKETTNGTLEADGDLTAMSRGYDPQLDRAHFEVDRCLDHVAGGKGALTAGLKNFDPTTVLFAIVLVNSV